jgi:hypothetical protein
MRTENIVRAKTPPPIHERYVCREPTPCPEVVEKVVIKKPPQRVIERIIEKPRQPPPQVIEREYVEGPEPEPIYSTRVMTVSPTPGKNYVNYQNNGAYGYPNGAYGYDGYGYDGYGGYGYDAYGNMCNGCGGDYGVAGGAYPYSYGGAGPGWQGGPVDGKGRGKDGMWVKRRSKWSEIVLQACDLVYTVLD